MTRSLPFRILLLCALVSSGAIAQDSLLPPTPPQLRLAKSRYRLRAGEPARIEAEPETIDFLLHAAKLTIMLGGKEAKGIVVAPNVGGDQVVLAAAHSAMPGEYTLTLSAVTGTGEERSATIDVAVDPMQTVPSNATAPPVVLLNGWQASVTSSCPIDPTGSAGTFGSLQQDLSGTGVPAVYFFDNCVECPNSNCKIEDLGDALGQFRGTINYDSGAPVPQIDLVAHSMGGLIARSYLAGLLSDGSLLPPLDTRIRKLILIATPNFGSFLAKFDLLGTQAMEMVPGSSFLWNLATWNQRSDDIRGVDALAIIGNAGSNSDGVVSLTSASLRFARDPSRTRIPPYCHVGGLGILLDCAAGGIANVDEAPLTGQIVLSFLADTSEWMSIGATRSEDPYLSLHGGMYFALENAAGQFVNDVTQVSFGTFALQNGGSSGAIYYSESVEGSATFTAVSTSLGQFTWGPIAEPAGYYSTWRAKYPPILVSVGPLLPNASGLIVQSGATINIGGLGFGQPCSSCQVLVYPSGVTLQVSTWTDSQISGYLPAYTGVEQIVVQASAGRDAIDYFASPAPAISVAPQSLQFSYSAGGRAPIGQTIQITASGGAVNWTALSTAPWLSVAPASGIAPSAVTVSVAPLGLSPGTYNGTIQISSNVQSNPSIVTVTLTVAQAPASLSVSPSALSFNYTRVQIRSWAFFPGLKTLGIAPL